MRGMGGIALAEKIIELRPNSKIVFCTGYEEYALPAFKLHASGYLMKPISAEDVQCEIDNIKGVRQKEKLLEVKCFGNFEIYAKGERLLFKRSRTRELFAFLVDRQGAGMTAKQICAVLFPDDSDDLPPFIEDDNPYIWKRTTWVYGRGESPAEAFSDLVSIAEDIIRERGLELRSSIYTK
jgi:hypothetical protein